MRTDQVERALDESLARLRRDRVDFYCVHEPDQFIIDDTLLGVFDRLKEEGRIGAHGLAWGREVKEAPAGWDIIQSLYSPGRLIADRQQFFHGVLRRAGSGDVTQLAIAMRENPQAVFIASASEPHQLDKLTRAISDIS